MALAVPLSRFTSQVGGGSAFYVSPHYNAMIEFEHIINQGETYANYIGLTDCHDGKHYGSDIGQEGMALRVIDGKGREFRMKRHGGNQLTRCKQWFEKNDIQPDTKIQVRYDFKTGVLHLIPWADIRKPQIPAPSEELGSVSFTRDGRRYQVRCIYDAGKVQVRGSLDGKQVVSFEF